MEAPEDTVLVSVLHQFKPLVELSADTPGAPDRRRGPGRIEQGDEEIDDEPRQPGMVGQGLFHVDLRKGNSCLAQIFAIGPEDHNLAPRQPGAKNQAVEAVAFHFAAPDADEGVLKDLADGARVDFGAVPGLEADVVDHH